LCFIYPARYITNFKTNHLEKIEKGGLEKRVDCWIVGSATFAERKHMWHSTPEVSGVLSSPGSADADAAIIPTPVVTPYIRLLTALQSDDT
jgi:hypothetical protein